MKSKKLEFAYEARIPLRTLAQGAPLTKKSLLIKAGEYIASEILEAEMPALVSLTYTVESEKTNPDRLVKAAIKGFILFEEETT